MEILKKELNREMAEFKKLPKPTYYLAFRVDEEKNFNLVSDFGSVTAFDTSSVRYGTVYLRIGDYQLDNTHEINNGAKTTLMSSRITRIPMDNKPEAVSQFS